MILTYTISIDEHGNVYNDTQTHGSSFAEVYKAFIAIKSEVDRQIVERRNCPYNPKFGKEPRIDCCDLTASVPCSNCPRLPL